MESEPLSALNLSAWQAKEKKGGRESGNGNGSVGKETKQKLRKWQVRAKMESCPDLLVGVVPAFVCQSNIQLLHRFACLCVLSFLSSAWSSNVANVYCISIKSLPRSSSHLLPCHLQVRHLLPHGEKYISLSRNLSNIRTFKILNLIHTICYNDCLALTYHT